MDNYIALRDSLLALASDRTVRAEVSSKASGFARLMAEFTFFYGVSLALHLLRMTTPVVRAIQGPKQTVSATLTLVKELTEAVAGQRQRHDEFWERTTADASRLEVEEPRLKRHPRPPRSLDTGSDPAHPKTPKDHFKRLHLESIDRLHQAICLRYEDQTKSDERILSVAEHAML